LDRPGGSISYQLNVAVSESLLEYYAEESHTLISNSDFTRFVTPYVLKPIADCLRQIYQSDEDFANGVLMIVHQIPYEETILPKYPVETIAANKGDCELFSYVAASIMKAGGLDAVLLYYDSKDHMNIGVSLSHEPTDARGPIGYELHNGTKYYMAECTGGNWQDGWRVGECPPDLNGITPQIITLESCENSAPEQVSASLNGLAISAISLDISSGYLIQGGAVNLSGQLSPPLENETVTIYIKANGLPWSELAEVPTNNSGRFIYLWATDVFGICQLRASWSGDDGYASADSQTRTITVLPWSPIVLLVLIAISAGLGTAVFLKTRRRREKSPEERPFEIPS
jgi:hypothetical protein